MVDTMIIYKNLNKEDYNRLYAIVDKESRKAGRPLHKDPYVKKGRYYTDFLVEKGFLEIVFLTKKSKYGCKRSIQIKFKPKLLVDPHNYYDVTYFHELEDAAILFDKLISAISPELPSFYNWKCERIDFAITINSPIVSKLVKLLKMGDVYDVFLDKADMFYLEEGSVYMMGDFDGVNINFYDKFDELIKNGKPLGSDEQYTKAMNIMRLEVQCKVDKLKNLMKKYGLKERNVSSFLGDLNICRDIITDYYLMIAGMQDYYNIKKAIKLIFDNKEKILYKPKELIETLYYIIKSGSVWKAAKEFPKKKNAFDKRLREIKKLGINPTLIPDNWEEEMIPNIYKHIVYVFNEIERCSVILR